MPLGQAESPLFVTAQSGQSLPVRPVNGVADTALASASAAAPAAGAVVASLSGLAVGGVYAVKVALQLTGTAETQLVNGRVRQNGATIGSLPTLTGLATPPVELDRVTVGANGTIDVIAIAAATVGSIYTASIAATRLS